MGKITKKELVAAYKELDKVVGGVEPAINHDELTADEFEKELYETVNDLVEEDDEFSEKTQKVFDYLAEKYGDAEEEEDEAEEEAEDEDDEEAEEDDDEEEEPEPEPVKKGKAKKEAPVPAPKKGKAKPEPEPEEDDEDDEEAEEEDLASVVKSTMKKDALHDLINENVEFKKKRKELLAEKSVFTLKKMMLDILGGGAPKAKVEKEEKVKKEKPVKSENTEKDEEVEAHSDTIRELVKRSALIKFYKENKNLFSEDMEMDDYDNVKDLKKAMLKNLVGQKSKKIVNNPCSLPKVGVLAYIKDIIEKSGKTGLSRADIIEKLAKKFPDRPVDGMRKTVYAQVPVQLTKHGFKVLQNKNGLYVKG